MITTLATYIAKLEKIKNKIHCSVREERERERERMQTLYFIQGAFFSLFHMHIAPISTEEQSLCRSPGLPGPKYFSTRIHHRNDELTTSWTAIQKKK
jgi:hypothetical protein